MLRYVHQPSGIGGPHPDNRLDTVHTQPPVDYRHRSPRTIVTRREYANRLTRIAYPASVDHTARRPRIIAPIDRRTRTVRANRPQSLGIAEVAVDIFPPVIKDPPIGQNRAVPLEERALADLVNVGAIRIHTKKVRHDMPIAHAVLRLPRRRKNDPAIRKIDRVDIRYPTAISQLPEIAPIGVDLIDMIVVGDIATHRKDDPSAIERYLRVADHTVRHLKQRLYLPLSRAAFTP